MVDVTPVDYSTDVGRVRKYIPDIIQLPDPHNPAAAPSYMWTDSAIQSFLDDEAAPSEVAQLGLPSVLRAAASIMIATANNENLILKKLVTDDLQTDGPAVAKAMIAAAQELRRRADDMDFLADREEIFIDVPYPAYGSYDAFTVRPIWGL